jgi:hypothetical protein
MKCLCPQCTPNPAPTYTEDHRLKCEARHLARFTSDEERAQYIAEVRSRRGETAATALRKLAWSEIKSTSQPNAKDPLP